MVCTSKFSRITRTYPNFLYFLPKFIFCVSFQIYLLSVFSKVYFLRVFFQFSSCFSEVYSLPYTNFIFHIFQNLVLVFSRPESRQSNPTPTGTSHNQERPPTRTGSRPGTQESRHSGGSAGEDSNIQIQIFIRIFQAEWRKFVQMKSRIVPTWRVSKPIY